MSVRNEKTSYKKTCPDKKQKFGLRDDKDNMGRYPRTDDESEDHRKELSNEGKQDYKDYLSKRNDNFTKHLSMSVQNENNDYKKKCSDEKQKFGLKDAKHNMGRYPGTDDEPENHRKELSNEQQDYKDYLSKKNDNFTKNLSMFVQDEISDYQKKCSDEIQKFGLKDDKANMGGYPGTDDESDNHRKELSNERTQHYKNYLSKKNDNITKYLSMSVQNEKNIDYKQKCFDEKQKFGLKNNKDNMGRYPRTGNESENHRKELSNERKQDYKDYLSKKNDNFTKPDELFEKVNPDAFLGFREAQDRYEHHKF